MNKSLNFNLVKRLAYLIVLLSFIANGFATNRKTENLILITLDGLRYQELFNGLDLGVLKATTKSKKVDESKSYKKFWAETPKQRREKLMPFFWGEWMKNQGSVAGNPKKGSLVRLSNRLHFSYPGYSEILTGRARDDLIKSNDKVLNPNPTVLEFLRNKLQLNQKEVAAFASWDVIGMAVQQISGAVFTNAGYESYSHSNPDIQALNKLQFEMLTPWDSVRHDEITFRFAMTHLKSYRPRVLYLSLGETDDWAHDKRYDRVLAAISRFDSYFVELWDWLQSDSMYRNKTTILITTDHGRGDIALNWHTHSAQIKDSKNTWLAVISPDSPLRGEWEGGEPVVMDQIAATLCRFVGLDYSEQNPKAGKPIKTLFQ
ncbi:MAG: alkaline phosphatase family protein [Verrucomicrobiota bacterium]|nr:alkaline phosphatase family protein [Verrucomicrobiota bacterium]